MTNISDDVLLLGLGAFAFALLYTILRRTYHALRQRLPLITEEQRRRIARAAQRRPQRIPQGASALNQVAADTPAAPRAASANP